MTKLEELPNPERPGSYKEYRTERGAALQAEDLFHYFNHELFLASSELASLKHAITDLSLPAIERDELLALVTNIDTKHGDLQTIALDSIRMLAKAQNQQN